MNRSKKNVLIAVIFFMLLMLCRTNSVYRVIAQIDKDREYSIKAVFLYNFTKYILWPDDDEPVFIISVIGKSTITEYLINIAETKKVGTRSIEVREIESVKEISPCHILFIPEEQSDEVLDILEKIDIKNTLTVSEDKSLSKTGVAINFIIEKEKIRFELNHDVTNRTDLKVSSQLKKLAILVSEE